MFSIWIDFVCVGISDYDAFVLGEKEYYERQLATLRSFEEVDHVVQSGSPEEDDEEEAQHERAMRISNYANIVLLAFKVLRLFV